MKKEHDLVYDLGQGNWLDEVAGEAVTLGRVMNEPMLVMEGIELARLISQTDYNDDKFYLVTALGMRLREELDEIMTRRKETIFLDEMVQIEDGRKSSHHWEYSFVCVGGRYQIQMLMPEFYGPEPPDEGVGEMEKIVREMHPDFMSYKTVDTSEWVGSQRMSVSETHDVRGRVVLRVVEFDHEGCYKRGHIKTAYPESFLKAEELWKKMRAISDRKRED